MRLRTQFPSIEFLSPEDSGVGSQCYLKDSPQEAGIHFSLLFLCLNMVMTFLKIAFLVGIFIDSFLQLPQIMKCIMWHKMYRTIQVLILGYDLPN